MQSLKCILFKLQRRLLHFCIQISAAFVKVEEEEEAAAEVAGDLFLYVPALSPALSSSVCLSACVQIQWHFLLLWGEGEGELSVDSLLSIEQ